MELTKQSQLRVFHPVAWLSLEECGYNFN
jgi:hypothetical protein